MIGCFPINVSATCHACRVEREREKVTKKERRIKNSKMKREPERAKEGETIQ